MAFPSSYPGEEWMELVQNEKILAEFWSDRANNGGTQHNTGTSPG